MAKDVSKNPKKADDNAPVLVRVHKGVGFWDNTRRRVGDTFYVPASFADNSTWFHRADRPAPVEKVISRGPNAPGNANAMHPPGSPADLAKKRPESSSPKQKPAGAEDDDLTLQDSEKSETSSKDSQPSGDMKVI